MSSAIYRSDGKAEEYAPLAASDLYTGCSHQCVYCYAPEVLAETGMTWEQFCDPEPCRDVIKQLEKDCAKFAGDLRKVLMCSTSDPYQPLEKKHGLTRDALRLMADHDIRPVILTKAGPWAIERDGDILMHAGATWAAILTFDDAEQSQVWEPGAALPEERIEALQMAHDKGLETWVSFDPVLDPEVVLELINVTVEYVDSYKIGKINYHPRAKHIEWTEFKAQVEEKLSDLGKVYSLKDDLADTWYKTRQAA